MASVSMKMAPLSVAQLHHLKPRVHVCSLRDGDLASRDATRIMLPRQTESLQRSLSYSIQHVRASSYLSKPLSAVRSGLEASITDDDVKAIALKNAKIVVESQSEEQMQLRVDVTGEETQRVFDMVLVNLAKAAPPVPGFRRHKGGKTLNVPKEILIPILGEERVTKFVIQEIVTSSMTDYVKKENIMVKDKKMTTIQTVEELRSAFAPGKDFGFSALLELEISEAEGPGNPSSEPES